MARIRVKGGRLVDPFNVTPDDTRAMNFAWALSQINRYHGQIRYPYSVGQHSITLGKYVPPHLVRAAIIHDFAESLFNDLASPVKCELPDYKAAEKNALRVIASVYNVPWELIEEVSWYDKCLYTDESEFLHEVIAERGMGDDRQRLDVDPWFLRERYWKDVYRELDGLILMEFPDVKRDY